MSEVAGEYFGNPAEVTLTQRAELLWTLLRDDARYAFFGRMIFLNDPDEASADHVEALTKMQGAAGCQFCPDEVADELIASLTDKGVLASRYEQCQGAESAAEASREILSTLRLPEDLGVVRLDANSTTDLVADVAELSIACGVLPVSSAAMRGIGTPGMCLAAIDATGAAVATASAHLCNHRDSPHAKDAFWGKLATREDRRGQRIGLLLGAQVIVSMWDELGARGFYTGVQADNAASMDLCSKLGVGRSNNAIIACIDPQTLEGASFTR
jgi:hypothetical protein